DGAIIKGSVIASCTEFKFTTFFTTFDGKFTTFYAKICQETEKIILLKKCRKPSEIKENRGFIIL
ncbi:MAG: hypothetical protein II091_03660, partial [Lachnospiraceae bacterium]|nr:hypothetical protein [Lachnospiraceae bacterium]